MTLSGLDMALFATMLNERCVGRNAEIYLVAMDDNGVVRGRSPVQRARIQHRGDRWREERPAVHHQ